MKQTRRVNGPMPGLCFRLMSWSLGLAYFFERPERVLAEAGIQTGEIILDYACGPGYFSLAAARLTGPAGQVTAADIHPLAISGVARRAAKAGLTNIKTVLTSRATGLADASVDLVIFYDAVHLVPDLPGLLAELARVLRPGGRLSASCHHWDAARLAQAITSQGPFELAGQGDKTQTFRLKAPAA